MTKSELREAQVIIDAKCTITGCWKTKYAEAQKKLKYQEPMIEWYKVMVEWFAHYVRPGEPNQKLLPRLALLLKKEDKMDPETAEILKQGLIAMHDERHPEGD